MARRSKVQREKDLQITAERYLRGDLQSDIAKDLGVSQQTISNDLVELQARWQDKAVRDMDAAIAEELAKIDDQERECWDAWVRTKQAAEIHQQRKGEMAAGDVDYTTLTTKQPGGDPRFLDCVYRCREQRIKLLGLNKPEKHEMEHTGSVIVLPANGRDDKDPAAAGTADSLPADAG